MKIQKKCRLLFLTISQVGPLKNIQYVLRTVVLRTVCRIITLFSAFIITTDLNNGMCLQIQAWGPCVSCFVGCWKLCPLWNYQFSPFFVSVILRFPIDAHWFNPDSPPSLELCDSVTDFYGVWFLCLETRVFFFLLLHEESLLCNYNVIFFFKGRTWYYGNSIRMWCMFLCYGWCCRLVL